MIETLAIRGYRSLRHVVLSLAPLTVVTGANGSGKSSLYRALRLLAETAQGGAVSAVAREGGLESLLWAGPHEISARMRRGEVPVQGTAHRRGPNRVGMGFSTEDIGYIVEFGLPPQAPSDCPSAFVLDPEIKREVIFSGPVLRPASTLVDRHGHRVRARTDQGDWKELTTALATTESVLAEVGDPRDSPEVQVMRRRLRSWRFYDQFRTDPDAPARQRHIATRTNVLAHDGHDLAAALQTIMEVGDSRALQEGIADAFAGASLEIGRKTSRFEVRLRQPGLLRPLDVAEFSDGTLRFLLLAAALFTPRPPEIMVLNEPETSMHPDVLPALARLMRHASAKSQLLVVSHAKGLVESLEADAGGQRIELEKELGETRVVGLGPLQRPAWEWPAQ